MAEKTGDSDGTQRDELLSADSRICIVGQKLIADERLLKAAQEVVPANLSRFSEYSINDDRLDTFLGTFLDNKQYRKLWVVLQKVLILSYGQATEERGFSINKEIIEHMKEESTIAERRVFDAVCSAGGVLGVHITKFMLSCAQSARRRYQQYLEEQKLKTDFNEGRTSTAANIEKLCQKKRRLEDDFMALEKSADELANQAEETGDLTILSKSNALRKSAKLKKMDLAALEKELYDQKKYNRIKSFNIPVVCTENPKEYMYDDTNYDTGYVLEEFEGDIYDMLFKADLRLWGPTIILQYAEQNKPLPFNPRPLYCTAMQNLIVCFTGFRNRAELSRLVSFVHHMGGSIRKEFSERITHLVAKSTDNEKYQYAITFGMTVMTENWIHKTWERRSDASCSATDEALLQFKMLPFHLCRIVFLGFTPDEQKHMEELTRQNGGEVTHLDDELRTHLVFEDQCSIEISKEQVSRVHLIKAEWFWISIQMDACADESLYLYKQNSVTPQSQPTTGTPSTPGTRLRKRKRLKETVGQLAQLPDIEVIPGKRRSTDLLATSLENSFLDATTSPDRNEALTIHDPGTPKTPSNVKSPPEIKNLTGRQQVCLELLQTENNYVGILNTIMTVFKVPLETQEQVGGPLLGPTEVKIIFGNLEPIVEVHSKLRDDLTALVANWKEDFSVGNVILKHSQDLLKAYPSFVNFFEKTKEVLQSCDRTKPRFHAFLKICQSKPECGRQTLVELLIRPVQRLPSIILLLTDLLKHTSKNNSDHAALEEAIKSLREVLTHINEDKRKTEGQVAMFDIVNDIENCPPNLLSSHRTFITKADMVELSDSISGKGDHLSMFLFSDMLEICKRRTKLMGSLKSPSTLNLAAAPNRTQKCYKHLELMPVSNIKRVVDIRETEECKNVFALVCRSNQELRDRLYTFALVGPDVNKCNFLKIMCRHLANSICRADAENFLTSLEPQELDIDTSEVNTNSLSKAMSRLASKTSRRVGRAFSFNRTPRNLKRAMSTIISPFHSPSSETPAVRSQRLGCQYPSNSAADLQEMDSPPPKVSFKITKLKSSSLGASSSKLL